jgi:hypothetical protein
VQFDSRLHFPVVAISSWLGGQHGEEAKEQDEVGGEEDRAQNQAQGEEEVANATSQSSTSNEVEAASHRPAKVVR